MMAWEKGGMKLKPQCETIHNMAICASVWVAPSGKVYNTIQQGWLQGTALLPSDPFQNFYHKQY